MRHRHTEPTLKEDLLPRRHSAPEYQATERQQKIPLHSKSDQKKKEKERLGRQPGKHAA